jgi:hypothetical protein
MYRCIAVVLLLFAPGHLSLRAQTGAQERSDLRKAISTYIPTGTTDLSIAQVTNANGLAFLVAAWSLRSGKGFDSNVIVVEQTDDHAEHVIGRFSVPYGYSPNVLVKPEFTFHGTPVALVETQFGAAASSLLVVGASARTAHNLGSIDANYFDFIAIRGLTLLVGHEDVNVLDVPHLYKWTGMAFVDASTEYPEFYRDLVAKLRREQDVSQFAPAVRQNFAELIKLAGVAEASDR